MGVHILPDTSMNAWVHANVAGHAHIYHL